MDAWPNTRKLPFSKRPLSKRVIFSYIIDYVVIIALVAVFFILDKVPGFRQHFSLNNIYIQYPYAEKERVSVFWLVVLSCLIPAGIISLYTMVIDGIFSHQSVAEGRAVSGRRRLLGKYRFKDRLWELNCGILGLFLSVGLAFTVTGALKNAIGKPRPDLISRCKPREGATDNPVFGLSDSSICTADQNSYLMKDGFRSWPSGHASTSFAGLYYLSLYLAAKLHVLDSRGEVWKTFVVLVPTLGAFLIAGSRIMDYRHHPFDVITGGLLGVITAWVSYRQYFPPLSEPWKKGRAHPIRSWGHQPEPPQQPLYVSGAQTGAEPLRERSWKMGDEEMGLPTNRGLMRGESPGPQISDDDSHGGNVFRKQVASAQRQRGASLQAANMASGLTDVGAAGSSAAGGSSYDNPRSGHHPAPLRVKSNKHHGRGRHDGYWSSSSEEGDREDEGFELQPSYTLSDPSGPHDPREQVDTGYHPARGSSMRPGAAVPPIVVEQARSSDVSRKPVESGPAQI